MEGTRLGPYQLHAELGSGGMGKVYRAEVKGPVPSLEPGCAVALKVIHAHLLETPGFFKRFLREADLGRTIVHENVVRTYDCDALLHDGTQQNFLVMEYVEGQTLRDLLSELERVPEELCRHIGREVANGLAAIHGAGVLHRDLKPENVLITPDHVVKIMDLGVARLQAETVRLSQTGAFVGSLEYAAPEQFRSSGGKLDGRADLHALGVVLYELATGQHPYRDEDASRVIGRILNDQPRKAGEVNPQLSPFFEQVVHTLIAKDPDARLPSASALASVFEQGEASAWWVDRAKALRVETRRPLRRIRIPRETALYGRDEELDRLHNLYARAKDGDGQVLLIEGEAGIGKTRLIDEFVGRLRAAGEDVNFLFGSYPPGGAATAAGAFSTAYREHFGEEGLRDALSAYLKPTPILVPAFDALLRGEPSPKGEEPLTKKLPLQTVFVHATRGLAAERTTIVLIDDLHFAPEDGRALFSSLAMAVPGHRVLLIGTMRPGVPESWTANLTRLEHTDQWSLTRLGPKDLFLLLKDSFRSDRLAQELGMQISLKCDGNPFFALEIIRGLRDGHFLAQRPDGTWITTQVIDDIQVPSSVLDLVNARIAGLSEVERDLLDVAACCGFEFEPGLVGDAIGMARIPALKRFGHIERRHRLIRASGRRCVFDHHQVQEALYNGLLPELREAYHASIAAASEARVGSADGPVDEIEGSLAVDLCEHWLKGARGDKALRYLEAALDHLEAGYLNDQAIRLAERALSEPRILGGRERVEILTRQGTWLDRLGRREEQARVLAEAHDLALEVDDPALLLTVEMMRGVLAFSTGDADAASERYERALVLARESGDRQSEAAATGNLGNVVLHLGRFAEAQAYYERALTIIRDVGDRRREGQVTGNLGTVFVSLSRYEEARAHYESARSIARELGSLASEGFATGNLGIVSQRLGRFAEAQAYYEAALTIARQIGHRTLEASNTFRLGSVSAHLGQLDEAEARFRQALSLDQEAGNRRGEGHATGSLAQVFAARGQYEEALGFTASCLTVVREIEDRETESATLRILGSVLLALGRHEEARVQLEQGLALSRAIGDREGEGLTLLRQARVAREADQIPAALGLAGQALDLLREIGHGAGVADALVRLGELRWIAGEPEGAEEALREAEELLREQENVSLLTQTLALRACLPGGDLDAAENALRRGGERSDSLLTRYFLWRAGGQLEHLAEAKRLLDIYCEHAPEEDRASMRTNVALHRAILEAWAGHGGGDSEDAQERR